MIRAVTVLLVAVLATACGAGAPAKPPETTRPAPAASATPEPAPLLIEYVVIHRRWVEKVVPASDADVKAWADAPENAAAVSGSFRQILVKAPGNANDAAVAPQRKKAQDILDRIKKGEDFEKLAQRHSDDAASRADGGQYAADKVKDLPDPIPSAFAGLNPGEVSPELVRTKLGFHVIKKERAAEDRIELAYRIAKAPQMANKLAAELLSRFKSSEPSRAVIAEAIEAVLGERAVSDANRPAASVVDRERVKQARLPAAAKAGLETFAARAHAGDVLPSPAVDGDAIVVARAVAPAAR